MQDLTGIWRSVFWNHPSIVKAYGILLPDSLDLMFRYVGIVQAYCHKGGLDSYLRVHAKGDMAVTPFQILEAAIGLAKALTYLVSFYSQFVSQNYTTIL